MQTSAFPVAKNPASTTIYAKKHSGQGGSVAPLAAANSTLPGLDEGRKTQRTNKKHWHMLWHVALLLLLLPNWQPVAALRLRLSTLSPPPAIVTLTPGQLRLPLALQVSCGWALGRHLRCASGGSGTTTCLREGPLGCMLLMQVLLLQLLLLLLTLLLHCLLIRSGVAAAGVRACRRPLHPPKRRRRLQRLLLQP